MSNKDIASLLGDFAFTIIPKLSEEKKPTIHELENAILNLKELIWKLEDAILDCTPNDEFTIRFLTEKFN